MKFASFTPSNPAAAQLDLARRFHSLKTSHYHYFHMARKNYREHLRWRAEKIGKAGILSADNTRLGFPDHHHIADKNKAKKLDNKLDRIHASFPPLSYGPLGLRSS